MEKNGTNSLEGQIPIRLESHKWIEKRAAALGSALLVVLVPVPDLVMAAREGYRLDSRRAKIRSRRSIDNTRKASS
jgi:hypothetical protein